MIARRSVSGARVNDRGPSQKLHLDRLLQLGDIWTHESPLKDTVIVP
jgi:hypothetical protein